MITAESGLLSIGDLSKFLGFNVTVKYVTDTLEVPPKLVTKLGAYWSRDQLQRICLGIMEEISFKAIRYQAILGYGEKDDSDD